MLPTIAFVAIVLAAAPAAQRGATAPPVIPGRMIGPGQMTVVSGSLTGTVRDQSRALVPGIQVIAILETEANVQPHRTTTDQEGRFRFSGLPLGTYCLSVKHGRADITTRTGIRVRGAKATNVPVVLGERPPAQLPDPARRQTCAQAGSKDPASIIRRPDL